MTTKSIRKGKYIALKKGAKGQIWRLGSSSASLVGTRKWGNAKAYVKKHG